MEHHDPPGPDPRAPRPTIHVEDLVIDQDPPTLEEGASPDAIHVSVRLDLDVCTRREERSRPGPVRDGRQSARQAGAGAGIGSSVGGNPDLKRGATRGRMPHPASVRGSTSPSHTCFDRRGVQLTAIFSALALTNA